MNKTRFLGLLIFLIVSAFVIRAQQVTLSADAEYGGMLLDKSQPVVFHRNGKLASATLKNSFTSGNFTFAAGKTISFYQDGSINAAELAGPLRMDDLVYLRGKIVFHNNGKIQTAKVQAGSFHNNLRLPIDVEISLDKNGIITNINSSMTYFYQVLGMTVRGTGVELAYDEKAKEYKLYRGTNGAPQLAGVLMITRSRLAQPLRAEAIVMPIDSTFQFFTNKAPLPGADNEYDSRWYYSGTFTINNMNFGRNPFLWFKGNRLMAVQVAQQVTVQTYTYSPNEFVILDDAGNVIPTQFINP